MNFEQFGLPGEAVDGITSCWEYSQASYPENGVYFLQDCFLREVVALSSLRPEAAQLFFACGVKIRENEALSRLAWHCHWMHSVASPQLREKHDFWNIRPCGCSFFPAIVAFAVLPKLKAFYEERGIPERILRNSATVLDIWSQRFFEKYGEWGCEQGWINQTLSHNLFRLHRLEFQFSKFSSDFRVFKNKCSGEVMIMAPAGLKVHSSGFFCQNDETAAFETTIEENAGAVTGYCSMANGRIAATPSTLDLSQWEELFQKGDDMVTIHIPAIAPLTKVECQAGIDEAREFFPKYFPEFKFKGFQTSSWLLDPAVAELMPPTANIPQFQSLFHIYPVPNGNDWQLKERVFGNPDLPMDAVPQRTSLQKIIREKIVGGYRFRSGGMFLER